MKNTHFLTYLSALFLLCSLTSCYEQVYTYTTRNESSVPIKINAQRRVYDEPVKIIRVGPGEEFTEEYINKNPEGYSSYEYFKNPLFLEVIYNNEKKEVFPYSWDRLGDSLKTSLGSYIDTLKIHTDKDPFDYYQPEVTFIFTEEDYENATDCGGDCE